MKEHETTTNDTLSAQHRLGPRLDAEYKHLLACEAQNKWFDKRFGELVGKLIGKGILALGPNHPKNKANMKMVFHPLEDGASKEWVPASAGRDAKRGD